MSTSLQTARSAPSSDRTDFDAIQMPIEGPVSDLKEAVQKLKQCPLSELRRSRRHHRRALVALKNGGYEALSSDTRQQLVERLQTDLEALNKALKEISPKEDETDGEPMSQVGQEVLSYDRSSSFLRDVLPWNWSL